MADETQQSEEKQPEAQRQRVPMAVMAIQTLRRTAQRGLDDLDYLILRAQKGAKFDRGDMLRAFSGTKTAISGLAVAVEMALRDLFGASSVMANLEGGLYQQAVTLSTLIELLKVKGVVTEQGLEETWQTVVKPKFDEAAKAREDKLQELLEAPKAKEEAPPADPAVHTHPELVEAV